MTEAKFYQCADGSIVNMARILHVTLGDKGDLTDRNLYAHFSVLPDSVPATIPAACACDFIKKLNVINPFPDDEPDDPTLRPSPSELTSPTKHKSK